MILREINQVRARTEMKLTRKVNQGPLLPLENSLQMAQGLPPPLVLQILSQQDKSDVVEHS